MNLYVVNWLPSLFVPLSICHKKYSLRICWVLPVKIRKYHTLLGDGTHQNVRFRIITSNLTNGYSKLPYLKPELPFPKQHFQYIKFPGILTSMAVSSLLFFVWRHLFEKTSFFFFLDCPKVFPISEVLEEVTFQKMTQKKCIQNF